MIDPQWNEEARPLAEWIAEHLDPSAYPVLIQAGHFMLLGDTSTGQVDPMVIEEAQDPTQRRLFADAVGVFPTFSWILGVELVALLLRRGIRAELCTIVNDWQYIPREWPEGGHLARMAFYEGHRWPLPSQRRILETIELSGEALADLDPNGLHGGFLSERWLRRRLERRLNKAVKKGREIGLGLELRPGKVSPCMIFPTLEGRFELVSDGQANCAGEMTEFVRHTSLAGYKSLVNMYPHPCEHMVTTGTQIGLDLFGLDDLAVLNVGLSAAGERTPAEIVDNSIWLHRVARGEDQRQMEWKKGEAEDRPGLHL